MYFSGAHKIKYKTNITSYSHKPTGSHSTIQNKNDKGPNVAPAVLPNLKAVMKNVV